MLYPTEFAQIVIVIVVDFPLWQGRETSKEQRSLLYSIIHLKRFIIIHLKLPAIYTEQTFHVNIESFL